VHVEGAEAPTMVLYVPAMHDIHAERDEAPTSSLQKPAGQGRGARVLKGQ